MRKLSIEKLAISYAQGMGSYWKDSHTRKAQIRYLEGQPATAQVRNIESLAAFAEQDKQKRGAAGAGEVAKKEAAETAMTAQRKAIELYPDLSVADSPLNKEFRERMTIYRIEKKEFFAEPDWPTRLAKECSEALAAKPKAK
jgi:hypothetical protein